MAASGPRLASPHFLFKLSAPVTWPFVTGGLGTSQRGHSAIASGSDISPGSMYKNVPAERTACAKTLRQKWNPLVFKWRQTRNERTLRGALGGGVPAVSLRGEHGELGVSGWPKQWSWSPGITLAKAWRKGALERSWEVCLGAAGANFRVGNWIWSSGNLQDGKLRRDCHWSVSLMWHVDYGVGLGDRFESTPERQWKRGGGKILTTLGIKHRATKGPRNSPQNWN